jgi:hypothetical protein
MVIDIWTEMANDRAESTGTGGGSSGDTVRAATQEDFDRF